MTLRQFQKRTLNKETYNDLHSQKYKFMLLGKKKQKNKPLLEANIKMELINFYPSADKIFISS